jgi:hypothetical protein
MSADGNCKVVFGIDCEPGLPCPKFGIMYYFPAKTTIENAIYPAYLAAAKQAGDVRTVCYSYFCTIFKSMHRDVKVPWCMPCHDHI